MSHELKGAIKLAPVIKELERQPKQFKVRGRVEKDSLEEWSNRKRRK